MLCDNHAKIIAIAFVYPHLIPLKNPHFTLLYTWLSKDPNLEFT